MSLTPRVRKPLNQIAEREGIPVGTLLRRIIEEWAQAYSRVEAAEVGEYLRTSEEGKFITAFGGAALIDMAMMGEGAASVKPAKA